MNILLVDDHVLFREGMKFLLSGLSRQINLTEAESCEEALEILGNSVFDLILLDLNLPGKSRMGALLSVREAAPDMRVVVLSGEEAPDLIRASIDHGAMGFIPKTSSHEVLIHAMKLVLAGGVYLPAIAIASMSETACRKVSHQQGAISIEGLSPRQLEVLQLIIEGKSNKVIAAELCISENTVKTHVAAVMRVLNASSRTEAVYLAAKY